MSTSRPAYLSGVTPKPFRIELGGLLWSGAWIIEGRNLCMLSAYGGVTRSLGRRKPERLAEALLREVLAQRAEDGCLTPPR